MRMTCKQCHEAGLTLPKLDCKGCLAIKSIAKYRQSQKYQFMRSVARRKNLTPEQKTLLVDAYHNWEIINDSKKDPARSEHAEKVLNYALKMSKLYRYRRTPKGTSVLTTENIDKVFAPTVT